MDFIVRRIGKNELYKLLELYKYLNPEDKKPPEEEIKKAWDDIMKNEDKYIYLVIEEDNKIISSCNISIIPNLTRGARPYAVIENVITRPDYRRKGLGRKVIHEAVHYAKKAGCYKVMLLSSSGRHEAHQFYESLGFSSKEKTGFVMKL